MHKRKLTNIYIYTSIHTILASNYNNFNFVPFVLDLNLGVEQNRRRTTFIKTTIIIHQKGKGKIINIDSQQVT